MRWITWLWLLACFVPSHAIFLRRTNETYTSRGSGGLFSRFRVSDGTLKRGQREITSPAPAEKVFQRWVDVEVVFFLERVCQLWTLKQGKLQKWLCVKWLFEATSLFVFDFLKNDGEPGAERKIAKDKDFKKVKSKVTASKHWGNQKDFLMHILLFFLLKQTSKNPCSLRRTNS